MYSGRMRRMLVALAVGLLVIAAGRSWAQAPAPAPRPGQPAPSLDEVVKQVEAAYGKLNDLKAEFDQTAFNKSLNQSIPAQGTVYLKKGGKLRWEYADPTPQQIVSDGKTLWIYTPALSQVNVGPAPEALAGPAGSFLTGLGKVREHFGVRFLNPAEPRDKDGNVVLDLTPKQPLPTMTRLILSLDPRSWDVRRAVVYDQFENTVTMQFRKTTVNTGLADSLFTFVAPKGVATVPLR
jgi:outer membrane lipoprotein carrier protein